MTVPSPSPLDKSELRSAMRQRRRDYAASLDPATREALEDDLATALKPLLASAQVVAAYQPMKDEISPLNALAAARAKGKATALPAFVARDSRMTFRSGEAIEPGPWGLLQPSLDNPLVAPDLVLVPLVVCDRHGNRVGMGQGHYDRALSGLRQTARLVGIGWDFQYIDETILYDPWDQQLHAFASPSGLKEFAP